MMTFQTPHGSVALPGRPPVRREKSDYIIHKVILALDILEQFGEDEDELSLGELCRRLKLSEQSMRPLLDTLRSRCYLERNNSTNNYRLGYKILELSQTVLRQTDLYRVSHPILASIAESCGENTAVAVLRNTHVIELDQIASDHPVQVVSRVGEHLPVYCTAAGKAILASLGGDSCDAVLRRLEFRRFTPRTLTGAELLRAALAEVRERGYAVEDEELSRDVRSVAAAINDYAGRAIGALVVTGPTWRITNERITKELVNLVHEGAREVSARLGFHGEDSRAA